MNVKRFVAADMRRALELVKREMGDDAIILSSKRTKAGVEILTSNNLPYEEARSASQLADSNSNYGAIANQVPPAARANLFSNNSFTRNNVPDIGFSDEVAMQSDDAWRWDNIIKQNKAKDRERGIASGKTHRQLSEEIEVARRKMEAADRIPFSQQSDWPVKPQRAPQPTVATSKTTSTATSNPTNSNEVDRRIEPSISNTVDDDIFAQINTQPSPKITEPDTTPSYMRTPFGGLTNNYIWHGPQDLSKYLIIPEPEPEPELELVQEEEREMEIDSSLQDFQLQALKDEITDMREMLHVQLERLALPQHEQAPKGNTVSLASAIKATIRRRLNQMGFSETDASNLLATTKVRAGLAETWTDVLATLAHEIPVTKQDAILEGGVYAFVGPSGAGKTATVSKLATQFVLKNPKSKLSLIVLEAEDAKQSPLVRLGGILDVPVRRVNDRVSLARAIAEGAADDLVLIDTPSSQLGKKSDLVQNALSRLPQIEKILVLPANAQAKALTTTVKHYQSFGIKECVLTKLDECASMGEVLSIIMQSQLPVAYVSKGQHLQKDLQSARGYQLVTMAVALLKKDQYATRTVAPLQKRYQSSQQSLSA